jgi:hypothetical protein
MKIEGHLKKMRVSAGETVQYHLRLDEEEVELNSLIGANIRLTYLGEIHCQECGKVTKKSWNQGYCYPCTMKLAQCDMCIVKPELCHYAQGTCREPKWGEEHCLKPHVVYLANSSGAKVGITREKQVPTRWMDQGAIQALPMFEVKSRLDSGKVEKIFTQHIADKTHWQRMLKGNPPLIDLESLAEELWEKVGEEVAPFIEKKLLTGVQSFHYPVQEWPLKIKSLGLEKVQVIEDKLVGIKGQYLMFSNGVINIRNHAAHLVSWEVL